MSRFRRNTSRLACLLVCVAQIPRCLTSNGECGPLSPSRLVSGENETLGAWLNVQLDAAERILDGNHDAAVAQWEVSGTLGSSIPCASSAEVSVDPVSCRRSESAASGSFACVLRAAPIVT